MGADAGDGHGQCQQAVFDEVLVRWVDIGGAEAHGLLLDLFHACAGAHRVVVHPGTGGSGVGLGPTAVDGGCGRRARARYGLCTGLVRL